MLVVFLFLSFFFRLKTYVLRIVRHVAAASLTELGPLHFVRTATPLVVTPEHSTNEYAQRSEIDLSRSAERLSFVCSLVPRGACDDTCDGGSLPPRAFTLWASSRPWCVTSDFLCFAYSLVRGCAAHNTAAHLSRFATTRVMLASRMVGATPQLPPCCIAAGCSPAAEM